MTDLVTEANKLHDEAREFVANAVDPTQKLVIFANHGELALSMLPKLVAEIEQLRRERDEALRVEAAADSTYTHWRALALAAEAEAAKLREAAELVVWFDWSDNDADAVAAIDALRAALADIKEGQAE